MLWELSVSEQRYRAVLEVLDGIPVTEVAERFGITFTAPRTTGFAALRSLAAPAGRLSDRAAAVSGGQIVLAPGLGTLPVPRRGTSCPAAQSSPASLPGPARPAARTPASAGSALAGPSPLIS